SNKLPAPFLLSLNAKLSGKLGEARKKRSTMNDSSNVNETHILVLKEDRGRFVMDTIPIEDCSYICTEIENAAKNPNKTVLDVQTIFNQKFQCLKDYYLYLYPFGYGSSYIGGAEKPKQYTYEEYQEELNKGTAECKDEKEKERKICSNQDRLKSVFKVDSTRYIHQQKMYEAFQKAENDPSVKMYSREAIGWKGFTYKITDDIDICISTNFGYGLSSYFTLTASYKGIALTPWSYPVKYFYVRMMDIIGITRPYEVKESSWYPALDFVKDFVNQSLSNPEQFVKEYLMNEVDELMSGLRNIMVNPQGVIDMFKRQMDNLPDEYHRLRFIEPMSKYSVEYYNLCPKEYPVVFKCEKFSDAIKMLEKLKELIPIYEKVSDYINEIIGMVNKLKQEVEEAIERMQVDIDKQNAKIALLKAYCALIDKQKTVKKQINALSSELNQVLEQNTTQEEQMTKEEIVARFKDEHPEFDSLHKQLQDVENQRQETMSKCKLFMANISTVGVYEIQTRIGMIEREVDDREYLKRRLSGFIELYTQYAETLENVG
ncbi:MAG: hypothetical protein ACI3ZY_07605, partial [Parabacteroides sp.]